MALEKRDAGYYDYFNEDKDFRKFSDEEEDFRKQKTPYEQEVLKPYHIEKPGFIQWYCGLPGHHFYLEVKRDFIRDKFN